MTKVKKQNEQTKEDILESFKKKAEAVFPDVDKKYIHDSNAPQDLLGAVKTTSRLSTKQRTFVKDLTEFVKTGVKVTKKKKTDKIEEENSERNMDNNGKKDGEKNGNTIPENSSTKDKTSMDIETITVEQETKPETTTTGSKSTMHVDAPEYTPTNKKIRLDSTKPIIKKLSTQERLRIILAKLNSD